MLRRGLRDLTHADSGVSVVRSAGTKLTYILSGLPS
jgi:hypothetical protein